MCFALYLVETCLRNAGIIRPRVAISCLFAHGEQAEEQADQYFITKY